MTSEQATSLFLSGLLVASILFLGVALCYVFTALAHHLSARKKGQP